MKRRLLMAAGGIASLTAVASCSKSPEKTPVSGMTSVEDVKQPQAPSKSPQDAPQDWTSMNFSGISLSLLSSLNLMSSYLFENYSEIGRVSWEASGDKPATERVAFSWGPTTSWLGWTWLLASEVGTGVVTLLSTTLDDGLRNGIENSLTLTRQQQ